MTKLKILGLSLVIFIFALVEFPAFAEEKANDAEEGDDISSVLVGGKSAAKEDDERLVKEGLVGDFTLGAGANTRSFKFDEYNGLTGKNQGFAVGDFDLSYNRDNFYYTDMQAENLGLDDRKIYFEAGKYNDFKFTAGFDQTPQLTSNTSQTIFNGAGTTSLTLPSGFGKAASTALVRIPSVNNIDLSDTRNATTFGFSKIVGNEEYGVNFKHETRTGLKSLGAIVGSSPGGSAVILPEFMDQVVNELQASVAHSHDNHQIRFDYFMSMFDNNNKSITWESPYTTTPNGLISRPPSSQFHRFSLNGGINLPYATRITGTAEYSMALQNEDLFPYAFGTSTALLPRSTADAKIQTAHVSLNGSSRPFLESTLFKDLFLTAKYRHHQTINNTPVTTFTPIVNDTGAQVAATSSDVARNSPFDYSQDQLKLDASYPIYKATYVNLGYDSELMQRSYREVTKTFENTLHAGVRSNFDQVASGNVNFLYGDKIGDRYNQSTVFNDRHPMGTITSFPFDNLTQMQRLDIANRERKKVATNLNYFPTSVVTLGINHNYMVDDYKQSLFGLSHQSSQDVTGDINFSPDQSLNLFLFYTYENGVAEQFSRNYQSNIAGSDFDPNRNWTANSDNIFHTVGVGAKAYFMQKKFSLDTKYTYSQGVSKVGFIAGSVIAPALGTPDVTSQIHRFEAKGKYNYSREITLGLSYIYENYRSTDFALDNASAATTSVNNVILLSNSNPNYSGHIGFVTATYHFGAPKSSGEQEQKKD